MPTEEEGPWNLPLPDFGQRQGPLADDAAVLAAFATGQPALRSTRLHVEDGALVVVGDVALGLRIGPRTVLVRFDLPPGLDAEKAGLESALADAGMTLLDSQSPLALPVALQVLGLRLSCWDLWGDDIDDAFAALRTCALGQDLPPAGLGGQGSD